jgi:ATP:ADP antiporter, AAA family
MPRIDLSRIVHATPAELRTARWAFLYFFALLASYYVLRPIRDEMAMQAGADALHELFSFVFAVMLALVPVFGWLTRRLSRARLLPITYGFFATNLLGFYGVLSASGEVTPLVGRVFFVWVSVFNLFAVSVFWSFMAELFTTEQAERLYGLIAAGGTAGALTGPLITASLVHRIGTNRLVLVSAALLGVAVLAIGQLVRHSGGARVAAEPDAPEASHMAGSVWSGLADVLRSRYLLGICAFLFCYALLSTFLYFEQTELVTRRYANSHDRTQLFAQADLVVNVATLLLQLFAFGRLTERFGTRFTLALMPALSIAGFLLLALVPGIGALIAFGVVRRAGEFAISKPARETLFNVLPPAQKYRAKNVIDTLVHRGGDTTSAWLIAGLRKLGLGIDGLRFVPVLICVLWLAAAVALGRAARRRRALAASLAEVESAVISPAPGT